MIDVITLDENYSTTRRVIKADPQEIAGLVKAANKPEDKFETVLFLPEGEGRQGEGGLRTKGYFKVSGVIKDRHSREGGNLSLPLTPHVSQEDNPSPEAKPLITVVTVVFNGEKFLEETILSVINQTYDNVEYIIIDGGSTDGTLDIIKKYEHAIDYWVSERDEGIYDAWNKAIRVATGSWIGFLGSDDQYLEDALCSYIDFLGIRKDGMNFMSSKILLINREKKIRVVGKSFDACGIRKNMEIAHVGSMHKRSLFLKSGLFNTKFKIAADYEFLLRSRSVITAGFMDKVTANMRLGGVSNADSSVFIEVDKIKILHNAEPYIIIKIRSMIARLKFFIRALEFR